MNGLWKLSPEHLPLLFPTQIAWPPAYAPKLGDAVSTIIRGSLPLPGRHPPFAQKAQQSSLSGPHMASFALTVVLRLLRALYGTSLFREAQRVVLPADVV